jgi:uncharacterized protein
MGITEHIVEQESEAELEQRLRHVILSTNWFMALLEAVRDCNPPDWLVGAGAIRNAVWDLQSGYTEPTPLHDVDVVFFDALDLTPERDKLAEDMLERRLPGVPWQAKNQAAVHTWYRRAFGYDVPPLVSVEDAVATWPETATCVGVRLLPDDDLLVVAPYGLCDLFGMVVRRNPRRVTAEEFHRRLTEKALQQKWPRVQVVEEETGACG